MNKKAILLLATLLITASMTTLETTARYRSHASAYDMARVARPVIRVEQGDPFVAQSTIVPGQTLLYDFSIANSVTGQSASDVCQSYWLEISADEPYHDRFDYALFTTGGGEGRQAITPDAAGRFPGVAAMDTSPTSHPYQLEVTLPDDAGLPAADTPVQLEILVVATQID